MHPLLLDLDGTLLDTRRDLSEGVNRLLESLGLPRLRQEQVLGYVGRGASSLIRRSLDAADPQGQVPRDDAIYRRFLDHYRAVWLDTTRPYPGVEEGLERLAAAGLPMAVVSNKPEGPTRVIVEGLGLSRYFGIVLGGDSLPTKKPDPAPLLHAAEVLGVEISHCIMVGDSDVDIEAARRAGCGGLWCSWGGIHPECPREPCRQVDCFETVVEAALSSAPAN